MDGKVPPADWPPFDAEYSVRATAPFSIRTSPPVWLIALTTEGCSVLKRDEAPAGSRTAPRYTWQAVVSHREPVAAAYERAATAWAFSASMPRPPPRSPQAPDISCETTPRR